MLETIFQYRFILRPIRGYWSNRIKINLVILVIFSVLRCKYGKSFWNEIQKLYILHKNGNLFLFLSWIRDLPRRPGPERLKPFGESLGFTPRLLKV